MSSWLHPLAFAVYPVLFLFEHNVREMPVQLWEVAVPIGLGCLAVGILHPAFRALLGSPAQAGLAASLTLLLFYGYGHACNLLAGRTLAGWPLDAPGVLLPAALALWLGGLLAIRAAPRSAAALTSGANAAAGALLAFTLFQIAPLAWEHAGHPDARTHEESPPDALADAGDLPDIYYLVLDAYARHDVLQTVFDHDNTAFLEALEARGFYVAREARANYPRTATSFAATLDYRYLDAVVERFGREHAAVRIFVSIANRARLFRELRKRGYTFVRFESGYWVSDDLRADVTLAPVEGQTKRAHTFLDLLASTTAVRPFLGAREDSAYEHHRARTRYLFDALPEVADGRAPVFALAHVMGPHPPFVFSASGRPTQPERPYRLADHEKFFELGGNRDEYRAGYADQVAYLNTRILHTIDRILARPGPAPVILVQGDHGSRFLTGSAESPAFLVEKLAILSAYHLPRGGNRRLYPTITPVNSFRVVLSHYFGMDLPLLPDRVFWAPPEFPLRLTDVTARTEPSAVAPR